MHSIATSGRRGALGPAVAVVSYTQLEPTTASRHQTVCQECWLLAATVLLFLLADSLVVLSPFQSLFAH